MSTITIAKPVLRFLKRTEAEVKCDLCGTHPSTQRIFASAGEMAEVCGACLAKLIAGESIIDSHGFEWSKGNGMYRCKALTPCRKVVVKSGEPDPECATCRGTGEMPGTGDAELGLPPLKCSCTWADVSYEPTFVPLELETEV